MYNALSQTELEAASSGSDVSDRSPVLESQAFAPLALDFENFGNKNVKADAQQETPLAAIIRSRGASTTDYELLEADDYKMVDGD
ncbi:hypothetical protein FQN49_008082, partial [Arthroderma sp. PD_2]